MHYLVFDFCLNFTHRKVFEKLIWLLSKRLAFQVRKILLMWNLLGLFGTQEAWPGLGGRSLLQIRVDRSPYSRNSLRAISCLWFMKSLWSKGMPRLTKKVLCVRCEIPGVWRLSSFLAMPLDKHNISVAEECSVINGTGARRVRNGVQRAISWYTFCNYWGLCQYPFSWLWHTLLPLPH